MKTIGERIKYIRTEYGEKKISMAKFAESIGVTSGAVAQWETMPDRNPSNAVIKMIAKVYGINETWLLTGEGRIDAPLSREDEMAQLAADLLHCDDKFIKEVTRELLAMTPEQISAMKGIILHLADVIKSE